MSRTRRAIRHLAKISVLALLLATLVAARHPSAASAYTPTNSGCQGSVQVPKTQGFKIYGNTVQFPARTVWRSPCFASSTQDVYVKYRIWVFNLNTRQWSQLASQWRSVRLAPGTNGTLAGWGTGVTYRFASVDVDVQWWTPGGKFIGSTYINYDRASDYSCACSVYGGDPVVGAYMDFGAY